MMKQQHIHNQLTDYTLGLLSQRERQRVEQHTMACADCHRALRREMELGLMVRSTLATATQPPANLRPFMPAIPRPRLWQRLGFSLVWQRQLAPIALFLILLMGSAGVYLSEQQGIWTNPSPTFLAVTATMTDKPTATDVPTTALTQTRMEAGIKAGPTAVSTVPGQPQIAATPAPNPTPIAALPIRVASN